MTPWSYSRFASIAVAIGVDIGSPLALNPMGDWDPTDEYWGEPGDAVDPFYRDVIASGVRPRFEMEQVLPGVESDDWDTDPILEAMDLHHAGHRRAATRLLEDLLAIDVRCIDAGAVAEASLPPGFAGVLPRGMIDNRPFMRCLHGLALCAWRQRRWDDAEAMFTARIWLDPTGSYDALACLEPVRARQRWTQS